MLVAQLRAALNDIHSPLRLRRRKPAHISIVFQICYGQLRAGKKANRWQ
jgi:hypothetical protein